MLGCSRLAATRQPVSCLRKGRAWVKPLVMAARSEQTHSADGKRSHAVDSVRNTARYTAQIGLGRETVTQKDGLLPTEDPLKLTIVYPVKGLVSTISLGQKPAALPEYVLLQRASLDSFSICIFNSSVGLVVVSSASSQNANLGCSAGVDPDLPWIFLLPGANCYSQDYIFLETYLAGQGYLVAVVDQLHPATPDYALCVSRKS